VARHELPPLHAATLRCCGLLSFSSTMLHVNKLKLPCMAGFRSGVQPTSRSGALWLQPSEQ